jgi:hypothetical protein
MSPTLSNRAVAICPGSPTLSCNMCPRPTQGLHGFSCLLISGDTRSTAYVRGYAHHSKMADIVSRTYAYRLDDDINICNANIICNATRNTAYVRGYAHHSMMTDIVSLTYAYRNFALQNIFAVQMLMSSTSLYAYVRETISVIFE